MQDLWVQLQPGREAAKDGRGSPTTGAELGSVRVGFLRAVLALCSTDILMNCWFYVLLPGEPGADGGRGDGAAPALLVSVTKHLTFPNP